MDNNAPTREEIEEMEEQNNGAEAAQESLSPEEQAAQAERKAAEYLDGWQRERAEFANARKRLERERAEAYLNANLEAVKRLLPVLDDFDRALNNVPTAVAADPWFEGIQMVRRKLQTTLENMNVAPIEAVGQPFDPNFHDALSSQPSDEYESGVVVQELQTGYKLGDRVIRPSLVIVAA